MISNITNRIEKILHLNNRPQIDIQALYQKALADQFPNYIINASSIKNYNVGYQVISERNWDYTTLDQDWKNIKLKLKFQIFISLLRLVYFLEEENVIHKNIKPNTLLFKSNKVFLIDFGNQSSDLRNFSNSLDEEEAKKLYPYLTEEILLKLKDKKYQEVQRRDIASRRRADREALALIMMEIFHPIPFKQLKKQITIENAFDFRQNIFEEIKKMEQRLTIQNNDDFLSETYEFVIQMLKNLLSSQQLPDKRETFRRCIQLKQKIPSRYMESIEQSLIEIQNQVSQLLESSSQRLTGNEEILNTRSPSQNGGFIQQIYPQSGNEQVNRNNDSQQYQESENQNMNNHIQLEDEDIEPEILNDIDVDTIDEPPAENELLKQFQVQQAQKIGRYQIGYQFQNEHCQVTQQMIVKGIFIDNCVQNGKITIILYKKDKILIKVFENVSINQLKGQTQSNIQVELQLINGQKSTLTKFQIGYQQKIKFNRVFQYQGIILNGKPHNYGIMENFSLNFKYDGDWMQGKREGFGTLKILDDKLYQQGLFYKYVGEFKANLLHGKGKYYMKDDGSLYEEGYFCDNTQKSGFHTRYQLQNKQIIKNQVLYINFCNQAQIRISCPFHETAH